MSDRRLSLTLAFIVPILFTLALPYTAKDLTIWIALGNFFLKTGTLPTHDIFSVLPTTEMIYPSYGSGILYGLLYRFLNLTGICIFHGVVVLPLLLFILYRPLIREGFLPNTQRAKWALFLFWLGGVPTFGERPSMLALIPLVLSLQIIANFSPNGELKFQDVLKLVGLEVLWANLHGSFVLSPLILIWKFFWDFCYLLKTETKLKIKNISKKIALVVAVFFSAGLNPFGLKIYPYVLETARVSKERGISEWDFPGLATQFPTGILFWLLFAYTVYFLWRRYQHGEWWQTISNPFFMFVLLGTLSIRNAALTFIVLLPGAYAAHFFVSVRPEEALVPVPQRYKSFANTTIALVALIAIPLTANFKPKKWDDDVAFALADQIKKDGRTCPIFNDWELGGFLMLELPNQTYLDTRNIIFSRNDFRKYQATLQGDANWKNFLTEGKACFVLIRPSFGSGLVQRLDASNEWEKVATEGVFVLYAKKSEAYFKN